MSLSVYSQENKTVKISMIGPENSQLNGIYVWLDTMRDSLSSTGIKTDLFPNSVLGNEIQRNEQLALGLLEIDDNGGSDLEIHSPLFKAFISLPFVFDDYEHVDRLIFNTDFIDRINKDTTPHGSRVIAFAILGSMAGIFNSEHAVTSLDDLQRLRIRAMEKSQLGLLNSWQVQATQVAWLEVAQALQTEIIQGYINPPMVALMFGHQSVLKHYTDLKIMLSMRMIVVSEDWYQSLDTQEKNSLYLAISKANVVNRLWAKNNALQEKSLLEKAGIRVGSVSNKQKTQFINLARQSYSALSPMATVKELLAIVESVR